MKTPKKTIRGNVTLDKLAGMVQRGSEEMAKKTEMDKQFSGVNQKLEKIEKILLAKQNDRIEKLEKQIHEIREALAMK